MKNVSLKKRLLALALTVVMLIGMMPSGLVAAEDSSSVPAANSELSIEEAIALCATMGKEFTEDKYYISGKVASFTNTSSGRLHIVDENKNEFYICDIFDATGTISYANMNPQLAVGDKVTFYGVIGNNNGMAQMQNAWLVKHNAVAKATVGGVETIFSSLAEAVAAADAGTTVTLLENASGAGMVISKAVTIDFNGKTYTVTEPVGSTGTVSNGLQLLKGSAVTLYNGTLNVDKDAAGKFYILVQNYGDLTVSGMNLDGTNLDKYLKDGDSYTLSINSGNVQILNSVITANDEGDLAYAFDVCQYSTYAAPSVFVKGTAVKGNVDTSAIGEASLTIESGSFRQDMSAYTAENFVCVKQGDVYVVQAMDPIWQVGEQTFYTLEDAVAATTDTEYEIVLLRNASGNGAVINKKVVINFNNHTFSLTGPVGSTNTVSNGLQLLKGSAVTLRNGTLNVDKDAAGKFYMLVQNYGDLTVSDMILDGENLDKYSTTDGDSYTLSINSGNVLISGSTIKANDQGDLAYAFDVCQYSTYAAPQVTVKTGTSVEGKVDTSSIGAAKLSIQGGIYTEPETVRPYLAEGFELRGNTVCLETGVTPISGGTVTVQEDGSILVYADNLVLDWSEADEEPYGGWWAGIKVTAPACLSVDELQNATIIVNGEKLNFWEICDSKENAPHYVELWMYLDHSIKQSGDAAAATRTYVFNWIEDGVAQSQTVVFQVNLQTVQLNVVDQAEFKFENPAVEIIYGDAVNNAVSGGSGEGAITYTSSNEDLVKVDENGNVTVLGVTGAEGVVITATKAASGKYDVASDSYTLVVLPKEVTVTIGDASKVYDQENPEFTYTCDVEGLDLHVTFDAMDAHPVAGSHAINATAEIHENGKASGNYNIHVIPGTLTVSLAEREVTFASGKTPTVPFGTETFINTISVPAVGNPVMTYSIVADGISASIDANGNLKIDATKAIEKDATITVTVLVAEDAGYKKCPASYTLTVSPFQVENTDYQMPKANDYGWYTEQPSITPADAEKYQIGFGTVNEDGSCNVPQVWASSVTCTIPGEADYVIFLRDIETGAISVPVKNIHVKLDTTIPAVNVSFDKNVLDVIIDKIFYVRNTAFVVTVEFNDEESLLAEVKIDAGEKSVVLTGEDLAGKTSYQFVIDSEYRDDVTVKVTNNAGVDKQVSTQEILVNDQILPVITAKFYGDIKTIQGKDNNSESDDIFYSNGNEFRVEYTITDNNFDLCTDSLWISINGGEAKEYVLTKNGDSATVSLALSDPGEYTISASFTDAAGNGTTVVRKYIVDSTPGTIKFSPNPNAVGDVYYSDDKNFVLDIQVSDTNYGLTTDIPVVIVDDEEANVTWTPAEGGASAKLDLAAYGEGEHVVTVTYSDGWNTVTETYHIHLDYTAPEFAEGDLAAANAAGSFVDLRAKGGMVYTNSDSFTIPLTVVEKHFTVCQEPVVTVEGIPVDVKWNDNGTANLVLKYLGITADGEYEIVVTFSDRFESAEYKVTVCIDKTAPVINEGALNKANDKDIYVDKRVDNKGTIYTNSDSFLIPLSVTETNFDVRTADPVITIDGTVYTGETVAWNENGIYVLNLAKLGLTEDKVYQIEVTFSDLFHEAEAYKVTVCIDKTAPVFVEGDLAEANKDVPYADLRDDGMVYTNSDSFIIPLSVTETNFDVRIADPVITVDGTEYTGEAVKWNEDGTYELNLAKLGLTEDKVYEIEVTFSDLFHEAEAYTVTVCIDKTAPVFVEGDLAEANKEAPYADLREDRATIYTNSDAFIIPLSVTETNFNVRKADPKITVNGTEYTGEAVKWNEDGTYELNLAKLGLTEDKVYDIVVTFSDLFHEAEAYTVTVCKDNTPPVIEVAYTNENSTKDAEGNQVTNGNRIYFTDNQTAVITITERNFDAELVTLNVLAVNHNGTAVGDLTAEYLAFAKNIENWTKKDDTWTLTVDFSTDANYTLDISVDDLAINNDKYGADEFTVDKVAPTDLKITYQQNFVHAMIKKLTFGLFYGNQTTVRISAKDETSGINSFEYIYLLGDVAGFGNAALKDAIKETEVKYDNGEYYIEFVLPTELTPQTQFNGYIQFTAADWAGYSSSLDSRTADINGVNREEGSTYYVIVDNQKPIGTITVTEPVKTLDEVAYYDGDITVNIKITESNFYFPEDVKIVVTKDGEAYTGYTQTNWNGGEKTLTLTEEGDYTVSVTYTDKSGNVMDPWNSGDLTLDTTAPVITVTNVKQNSANKNDPYEFLITVSDLKLDVDSVKPVLKAVVKGEDGLYTTKEIDLGKGQISDDGQTVKFPVENLPEDALYTLTCYAKDKSDNETSEILLADGETYETVNFSINRNGSTFGFGSDYTTNLVNQYYVHSVYNDVVIVEVNVDPIENYVVTVNGEELVENVDYTTEQTDNPGEWSKRTYTIKKERFAEEGEYNIVISSTDKANTTAYSDIKNLAVAFVVDQTAPVLTITGLQEGGRYQTDAQIVALYPTDEGGRLNSLKVLILDSDGKPLTDENGADISVPFQMSGEELYNYLEENGGLVSFTVPSGLEMQVHIICDDCAVDAEGKTNTTTEIFRRVTVSTNSFIIFYANKGAFYGTIGGVVVLAAAAIILIKRKKSAK